MIDVDLSDLMRQSGRGGAIDVLGHQRADGTDQRRRLDGIDAALAGLAITMASRARNTLSVDENDPVSQRPPMV
jgi:hypothetical protein